MGWPVGSVRAEGVEKGGTLAGLPLVVRRRTTMRTFTRGRVSRVLAQALTLTFLWSVAFMAQPFAPAHGQVAMRTAATQSVAVVPFADHSRFPLPTLGEEAAQAITVELRERLLLDVLPATYVETAMRDLGLKPPISDLELIRLGAELEVNMLVSGEVRTAEIIHDRGGRRGRVTLAVRLFDRIAEDSVNGALVEATGPALTDADDVTLIRKAVEQAAFQAIQEMRTHPSIAATVMWTRDGVVFVSLGSRAGVRAGMQMAAIRNGQRIGLIEITEADALGSYARLVSGAQLRPGDQLRGIYRLPARTGIPTLEKVTRKKRGLETLLMGAAGLLGLANVGSTARLIEEGNIAAPGFTASCLANEMILGYLPAAVILTWGAYREPTEKSRLLGWEIWNDHSGLVDIISVDEPREWGPYTYIHFFQTDFSVYWEGSWTIDATTGQADFVWTALTTDDPDSVDTGIWWSQGSTSALYRWWPMGPDPGVANYYRIQPVLAVQDIDGNWSIKRGEPSAAKRVTPLYPPLTSGMYIAGMTATFDFYVPYGANEAIIQIARDPYDNFEPDKCYTQTKTGLWTDVDPYALEHFDVNLSQILSLPGTGDYYWWRVGVRNRYDPTRPRPYPTTETNDQGWVWSDVQRITLWSGSAPASAVRREREAFARMQDTRARLLTRQRDNRQVRPH